MGFGFSVMEALIPIFFIIFIALFVFVIVKGIGEWSRNNRSPRLSVPAAVVAKRTSVTSHIHNNDNMAMSTGSSTTYYVTFEVESGDRMELKMSGREYGMLAEGDVGMLSFQGTRYLGFERR